MNTEEISLPFIAEDFEKGDRVYRYISATDKFLIGTVEAVEKGKITVLLDTGNRLKPKLSDFRNYEGTDVSWGKCLPIKDLHAGSVISLTSWGNKQLASILSVNEDCIVVSYEATPRIVNRFIPSKEHSLEALLMFWELEE